MVRTSGWTVQRIAELLRSSNSTAATFSDPTPTTTAPSGDGVFSSVTDGGIDEGETIVVADDAHGGVLAITTNDADNDMVQIQLNGEGFALASGRQLVFKTRLKLDSVSNGDIFAGLAIANTDVLAGVTDSIGFRIPDADGNLDTVAEKDSTETTADSGEDLSDDTFVTLTIDIDGTNRADFYVGNKAVANVSTNLPDDEALSPCFQVRNASAATSTLSIDYVRVAGDRS